MIIKRHCNNNNLVVNTPNPLKEDFDWVHTASSLASHHHRFCRNTTWWSFFFFCKIFLLITYTNHLKLSCFIIIGFNSVKLEGVYFQATDNIAQADSLYQKFKNVKTYIPKIWHLRSLILKMLSQITTSSLNSPWQLIESTFIILNSPKLNHLKNFIFILVLYHYGSILLNKIV